MAVWWHSCSRVVEILDAGYCRVYQIAVRLLRFGEINYLTKNLLAWDRQNRGHGRAPMRPAGGLHHYL